MLILILTDLAEKEEREGCEVKVFFALFNWVTMEGARRVESIKTQGTRNEQQKEVLRWGLRRRVTRSPRERLTGRGTSISQYNGGQRHR